MSVPYGVDELQPLRNELSAVCDAIQAHPHFDTTHHGELIAAAKSYDVVRLVKELRRVEAPLRHVSPLSNQPGVQSAVAAQALHKQLLHVYRAWSLSS